MCFYYIKKAFLFPSGMNGMSPGKAWFHSPGLPRKGSRSEVPGPESAPGFDTIHCFTGQYSQEYCDDTGNLLNFSSGMTMMQM